MQRQKYFVLLFFFSIPFNLMVFKGWWSDFQSNWSHEAYPYLVLFAALAEIYFSPSKLVTAGMFGFGALLLGLFLHTVHWPGAELSIVAGITCLMIIPLWSAVTTREQKTLRLIISIWILLYGIGALFRIFHWPAAGLFMISSIGLLSVVTIVLGISLWQVKQKRDDSNI